MPGIQTINNRGNAMRGLASMPTERPAHRFSRPLRHVEEEVRDALLAESETINNPTDVHALS